MCNKVSSLLQGEIFWLEPPFFTIDGEMKPVPERKAKESHRHKILIGPKRFLSQDRLLNLKHALYYTVYKSVKKNPFLGAVSLSRGDLILLDDHQTGETVTKSK